MQDGQGYIETLSEWGTDIFPKLSWFRQDKVKNARVLVVGCGALGNEVLKNLALFGVEHFVIVDHDYIEPSNLTRSILFSRADAEARKSKVEVISRRLQEINPAIQVLPVHGDIAHDLGLGILKQMDVAIGCVDNRYARYCLNRLCMRANIPWVDGGIDSLEGTARVFAPGKNCYACNLGPEGLKELSYRMSCSSIIKRNEESGRVPTTPIIASIIGAVQAQEAMKIIHKKELEQGEMSSLCGKMFYYEGQHLTSRIVQFQAYDDSCPVHEQWLPVQRAHSLTVQSTVGETLKALAQMLHADSIEITLRDHSFVDFITKRSDNKKIPVMLPDFSVTDFIEKEDELKELLPTELYQHEIQTVGKDFPYQNITLSQLGIPPKDILHIFTEQNECYIELDDDLHV